MPAPAIPLITEKEKSFLDRLAVIIAKKILNPKDKIKNDN